MVTYSLTRKFVVFLFGINYTSGSNINLPDVMFFKYVLHLS